MVYGALTSVVGFEGLPILRGVILAAARPV